MLPFFLSLTFFFFFVLRERVYWTLSASALWKLPVWLTPPAIIAYDQTRPVRRDFNQKLIHPYVRSRHDRVGDSSFTVAFCGSFNTTYIYFVGPKFSVPACGTPPLTPFFKFSLVAPENISWSTRGHMAYVEKPCKWSDTVELAAAVSLVYDHRGNRVWLG